MVAVPARRIRPQICSVQPPHIVIRMDAISDQVQRQAISLGLRHPLTTEIVDYQSGVINNMAWDYLTKRTNLSTDSKA